MAMPNRERHDPPGQTSAGPQRPAQQINRPKATFDLTREAEQLRGEAAYQRGDRNAKTLLKDPPLRLVLTVLKAGARMDSHQTEGPVTVHALSGRLRLAVEGEPVELAPGQVLALDADIRHDVAALEESALLLTIGWLPEARG
jgi:quercetin dioxygenase-like cupin family protein